MLLFNRYEYNPQNDLIGKGGFSKVYKALDKKLNRWLALKVYKISELAERYSAIAEIQRVINLDHPNICRYIDIEEIEHEDSFGLKETVQICVMELIDGGDFAAYYKQHGEDKNILKKLLVDVVKGLSYLHKNGVIHRDIKPANILIKETVEGPIAKITDFGISKRSDSTDHSSSSALIVSIPYMAPEQFNAKKYGIDEKISYNIDFWSLGVTVYETITGDVLFKMDEEDSREQVMNNIMLPDIPDKINSLQEPFKSFVSTCIVKDAKERVQDAEDLLHILLSSREQTGNDSSNSENFDDDITETSTMLIERTESEDETQILKIVRKEKEVIKELPTPKFSVPTVNDAMALFKRYEYNPETGLIGKGGFSRVYKAFDQKLSRWVALKIYKPGEFAEHYSPIAEIRRVVNLDHPNICRYLDMEEIERENSFGEREKIQICVMELLDGGNFSQYFKRHNNLEVLKKLLNDVLNGLSYLHKNGIIHRDIKPANILIKETLDGPVAKITDFGISKRSDAVNINTSSALIVSIPYMAPEQLNTKKYGLNEKITFNLDLWSLGVTIYEVITGKILFKNTDQDSPEQIMANIMAPELPGKINELPQPFRKIVSHCIIKDAKERAQKAEELIVLLHGNFNEDAKTGQTIEWITASVITDKIPKKNTIEAPEKPLKTPFYIEKTKEEKTSSPHSPGWIVPNSSRGKRFIFIGILLLLIISVSIYGVLLHNRNSKSLEGLPVKSEKKDTVKQTSIQDSANIKRPESSKPLPVEIEAKDKVRDVPVPEPAQTTHDQNTIPDKKPRRNSQPVGREDDNSKRSSNVKHEYILNISTTETCSLKIDGVDYGILKTGGIIKIYLPEGTHSIEATSTGNSSKVYKGNIPVTNDMLSQVGQVRIPL